MLLSMLILIPFLGSILSWQSVKWNIKFPRFIALFSLILCFFLILFLFLKYFYILHNNLLINYFFIDFFKSWIPVIGINFHIGVDGLSLLMIMMTVIMGIISVLSEWKNINRNSGIFYFFLLFLISGIFGIFLSLDLLLFFCFWELTIIPMYFFITFLGNCFKNNKYRLYVGRRFFIYSQFSGLFLFCSIFYLSVIYHQLFGIWTFDYFLLRNIHINFFTEFCLMVGFFLAFAIKMPLFPFHNWLPSIQICTPRSGSIDFLGILLKTAVYGFLRFNLVFFPRVIQIFSPVFILLGIISIFYGSIQAFLQNNFKKFISYISISHMGLIFVALNCINIMSYHGIILYLLSDILTISAILILIYKIQCSFLTRNILKIGNLWNSSNKISMFLLVFLLINLGFPGTGIFSGEILMLTGIFSCFPILGIFVIFGLFLFVICILNLMKNIFYGPKVILNQSFSLSFIDVLFFLFCFVILFFLGLFPNFVLSIILNK